MSYSRFWRIGARTPLHCHCRRSLIVTAPKSRYYRSLDTILTDDHLESFRKRCFQPEVPALLPARFRRLPACGKWFTLDWAPSGSRYYKLNYGYLKQYAGALVPLELTNEDSKPSRGYGTKDSFQRFIVPFGLFLEWTQSATQSATQMSSQRLYLAQCQLSDLPSPLREDLPTPSLVLEAGKGDIYDTNIWIGIPPTYTPLHRDPNPNLFVQLAGRKHVKLHAPDIGLQIFSYFRVALDQRVDHPAAVFRGDEMMQGRERALLEQVIWDHSPSTTIDHLRREGLEATLEAGDGIFIPKGWWHSIKGVGEGITASVNWWFR